MSLNEAQQRAILATEGPVVIVAPAGSGKTRVLVQRIAHLVQERETDPNEILGVTFTRRAAAEWHERLEGLLGTERAGGLTLGTFHSIGLRLLQETRDTLGLEHRVAVADGDGGDARLRRVVASLPRSAPWARAGIVASAFAHAKHQWASRAMETIRQRGALQGALVDYRRGSHLKWPDTLPAEARGALEEAFQQYQASLQAAGAVDLTDLLVLPLVLAAEHTDIRRKWARRWRYILVDEYQDTDPVQDLALEFLSAHTKNLCVVGDPAQAIYSWRGARTDGMRTFADRHPGTQIIALSHNYRSTPEILIAGEAGLRDVDPSALLAEAIATRPSGLPVEVWTCTDAESEGEAVARDILAQAVDGTRVQTGGIMVLGRSHFALEPTERALRRHGIPFVVAAGHGLIDRPGVRGALLRLQMIGFPDDIEAIHHLREELTGVGPSTVERLRGVAQSNDWTIAEAAARAADIPGTSRVAQSSLQALAHEVRLIEDTLLAHGTQEGVRAAIELSGLPGRIAEALDLADEEDDWSARAAAASWTSDANELLRLAAVWVAPEGTEGGIDMIRAFLTDLWTGAPMEWAPRQREARSFVDHPPVRLMTIHAAKGLEAQWVYLVGCEEGTLPAGQGGRRTEEQLGEEARLWYVGATRAQERLVTSWAMLRGRQEGNEVPMMSSRFLAAIPTTCHIRRAPTAWSRSDNAHGDPAGRHLTHAAA